jgi:hypothetical protein
MDSSLFPETMTLEAADFTQESHRRIFSCMRELQDVTCQWNAAMRSCCENGGDNERS